MSDLTLRPARPTDAGAVGVILSDFIDETPWMPRLYSRAEELSFAGTMIDRGWVRVAEKQGRVIGFCAFAPPNLHALYVRAENRSAGAGTALLEDCMARSASIELWTFQANTPAQAFYLGHGFYEVRRTEGTENDEGLPDIYYRWEQS